MTKITTTTELRTATHEFYIVADHRGTGGFEATYRPLNPKTGQPWQASRRITDGATIEPPGWINRPILYPTREAAQAAIRDQADKLAKSRKS
jgi:hypothetical protein